MWHLLRITPTSTRDYVGVVSRYIYIYIWPYGGGTRESLSGSRVITGSHVLVGVLQCCGDNATPIMQINKVANILVDLIQVDR